MFPHQQYRQIKKQIRHSDVSTACLVLTSLLPSLDSNLLANDALGVWSDPLTILKLNEGLDTYVDENEVL